MTLLPKKEAHKVDALLKNSHQVAAVHKKNGGAACLMGCDTILRKSID
ncbi:hypothetical protein [Acidovorax sp.]